MPFHHAIVTGLATSRGQQKHPNEVGPNQSAALRSDRRVGQIKMPPDPATQTPGPLQNAEPGPLQLAEIMRTLPLASDVHLHLRGGCEEPIGHQLAKLAADAPGDERSGPNLLLHLDPGRRCGAAGAGVRGHPRLLSRKLGAIAHGGAGARPQLLGPTMAVPADMSATARARAYAGA
jgi:hypothetical protein